MSNKRNLKSEVKKMRREFFNLFVVAFVLSFAFAACKKDKKNGDVIKDGENLSVIDVKNVVDDTSAIVTVKAEVWDYETKEYHVLASGEYKNSSFKLTLPATIPDGCLESIEKYHFPMEMASDKEGKLASLDLFAYNQEEEKIGNFHMGDEMAYIEVVYMYADRNFTVNGIDDSMGLSIIYDLIFKKGWNIRYFVKKDGFTFTTKNPAGVTLKWYFYKKK